MHPPWPRFLHPNPRVAQAALRHALENPAHPVHRTWKVKIGLVVFYPPELHLIGFEAGNKKRRVSGFWDQRSHRTLRRKMEISRGVNDVGGIQQKHGVELALLHLLLHLADLASVPVRLQP